MQSLSGPQRFEPAGLGVSHPWVGSIRTRWDETELMLTQFPRAAPAPSPPPPPLLSSCEGGMGPECPSGAPVQELEHAGVPGGAGLPSRVTIEEDPLMLKAGCVRGCVREG